MNRRVVTGVNESGKSVVVHDGLPPVTRTRRHTPGFGDALIWRTDSVAAAARETVAEPMENFIPGPGGTSALTVTIPPVSVFEAPDFDPEAARAEDLAMSPGLADSFEVDAPGMHTTPTVDYVVVIEGELVLELDDGVTVPLTVGDIVVQNSARHRWLNLTDRPATFFGVLMGTAGSA